MATSPIDGFSPLSTREAMKLAQFGLTPNKIKTLQNAYYYESLRYNLRSVAWLNISLGSLTLYLALGVNRLSVLSGTQALFGLLIIAQSVSGLIAPSVGAIFRWSLLLFAGGVWNIFIGILGSFSGLSLIVALLGVFQLRWAYQTYRMHQKYTELSVHKPSEDDSKLYHETWWNLAGDTFNETEPNAIRLQVAQQMWQGYLFDNLALLGWRDKRGVIVASTEELTFTPANDAATAQRMVKGTLKLPITSTRTAMPQIFYERYLQWKYPKRVISNM
jgi:hypothetical protein